MFRMAVISIGIFIGLSGCGQGEDSFRSVQFCFSETQGADELKRMLRQIADEEAMRFTDRSADAQAEIQAIGDLPEEVARSFPLIVVNIQNAEFGVGGGNLGLGSNQVALGFGPDSHEARTFATKTVRRLEEVWDVVAIPDGQNAFPLNCTT